MDLRPPTQRKLRDIAETHHLNLTDEELADFTEMIETAMGVYERLAELDVPVQSERFTDRQPRIPDAHPDPHNAFVSQCRVVGDTDGILSGLDVAMKDNIQVGGVEMTCGSSMLEGYIPGRDASVARLVLEAGGRIVGKTNMDSWAVSGTGEITDFGPVLNPHDPDYLAGGSSGGSAVAVVEGMADIAFGTDQAGSIRVPSAWSGCVGLKPTFGLVPYTGCVAHGIMFDHVGPMAMDVERVARAMDAVTVDTGTDPRQSVVPDIEYRSSLNTDTSLSVGILEEGFISEQEAVDDTVREALDAFEGKRISTQEVSIDLHSDGNIIWLGIVNETIAAMARSEGGGHYQKGFYDTQWLHRFADLRRSRADDFPPTMKLYLLLGQYITDRYHGHFHAKAQNLNVRLTDAYDSALQDVDVLAMPTTPTTAFEYQENLPRRERVIHATRKGSRLFNTMPFDVTGHPAVSLPCGTVNDLPVGLMFVGRRGEDDTVLNAAYAFQERVLDE